MIREQTCIHDLGSSFEFLSHLRETGGLDYYPSRAMLMPGTAVVGVDGPERQRDIEASHRHLRSIGVGASVVHSVHGKHFTQDLMGDLRLRRNLRQSIFEEERPLSFYSPRGAWVEQARTWLGVLWDNVATPHPDRASDFDNKLMLRLMGRQMRRQPFVPWRHVRSENPRDFSRACQEVLHEAKQILPTDTIVSKCADFDGGESVKRIDPTTSPEEVLKYFSEYHMHDLIVEAGYPADTFDMDEISLQMKIGSDDWELDYVTRNLSDSEAHIGNELTIGEPIVPDDDLASMRALIKPFCREAVRRGYGRGMPRGLGWDIMRVRSGGTTHFFIFEANARGTAPQYARATLEVASERFGGGAAVRMEQITFMPGLSYEDLMTWIGPFLWDGTGSPGMVLGNVGCIRNGKVLLFAVAKSLDQARGLLQRFQSTFTPMQNRAVA